MADRPSGDFRTLMTEPAIVRVLGALAALVGLWLAIGWSVSLP